MDPITVFTTKGVVARDRLRVQDVIFDEANVRTIATEWYLGDELVRRDVWVNKLLPAMAEAA